MALSSSQKRIHRAALKLFAERGSMSISVSELAAEAGVARGTIYNNQLNPDTLFEDIATQLSSEMNARIIASFGQETDSAIRLAQGVRMYIRRAHEDPDWARFICKFAFSSQSMMKLWSGVDSPLPDVMIGMQSQRYNFRPEQLPSVMALIAGAVLTSIFLVLQGHRTWRDAGADAAELTLRALGVAPEEALEISKQDILPLVEL